MRDHVETTPATIFTSRFNEAKVIYPVLVHGERPIPMSSSVGIKNANRNHLDLLRRVPNPMTFVTRSSLPFGDTAKTSQNKGLRMMGLV